MSRGGKTEGAGRPQGVSNVVTKEAREQALILGCKPLDVMLSMIKNELTSEEPDRGFLLELCKAAAPYVHAKMHDNKVTGALEIVHVPHVKDL